MTSQPKPKLAPARRRQAKADIITQAELQHVLDLETQKTAAVLALRGRLKAGAAVEQGPLTAELNLRASPPERGEGSPVTCIGDGLDHWGLTVGPTEWSAEVARPAASSPEIRAAFDDYLSPPRVTLPQTA